MANIKDCYELVFRVSTAVSLQNVPIYLLTSISLWLESDLGFRPHALNKSTTVRTVLASGPDRFLRSMIWAQTGWGKSRHIYSWWRWNVTGPQCFCAKTHSATWMHPYGFQPPSTLSLPMLPPRSSPDSNSCCCSIYLSSPACFHPPPVLSLFIIPLFIIILSLGNSMMVAQLSESEWE